ncbi:MAG: rocD [Actinomycetia bacterium]|nr:rocD [Actinomycetes bacterium]
MTEDANSAQNHIALAERWSAHNYDPLPVVLTHGEGAWVTDIDLGVNAIAQVPR